MASALRSLDAMVERTDNGKFGQVPSRILICGLVLFALSIPHSVAAAHISLGLSYLGWIVRDLAAGRFRCVRTPLDLPLFFFAILTILSSVFSEEPDLSMPKLKSLLLFGVLYLIATNLRPQGVKVLAGLLIVSSLVGVSYSLTEKLWGRGMILTAIEPGSPLAGKLQTGDVIWMVDRQRVSTVEEAAKIIRQQPADRVIEIEALHAGDPVPVTLKVTEELKNRMNPLGISVNGRSRQFRVSGFSRQFQTYAEQMQVFALLVFGGLLAGARLWKQCAMRSRPIVIFGCIFVAFTLTLMLTASRAVIVSSILTLLLVSFIIRGIHAPIIALAVVIVFGSLSLYIIPSARQQATLIFNDDSSARRIAYMHAGLTMIPQRPIFGIGMDSQKLHWKEWGFPGDYITHTHSTPIQIALDRGLPALGCYLWLIVAMFSMTLRGYRQALFKRDLTLTGLMIGALAVLIGFSASSLVNYNFGDAEILMLLLFIIGLVIVASRSLDGLNTKGQRGEGSKEE
jgi:O-Antigen ligase